MKILQIRFKNLNSLVGEWTIDLTHPNFVSDGIFAITGPTGAGKTTVLDAICLALYGRTPRLSKLTKNDNEIMSRHTGECFSEVTFETQAGRYRCHWSQHRARKKAEGELQSPKHEISHANSGQIFETKIRGVADQIVSVTGMDFEQFTRAMLLAQGHFAVFLQAAPDERAPILEQITGTEIYSQISIRVHELRAAMQQTRDLLQAELSGMPLLSDDDLAQLRHRLAEKNQEDGLFNQKILAQTHALAWLDSLTQLEALREQVAQQKQAWETRHTAFAPDREKLRLATQALELSGAYAALTAQRQEYTDHVARHHACITALPLQEAANAEATLAVHHAQALRDGHKKAYEDAQPRLRFVRELDLKIQEKNAPIAAIRDQLLTQEKQLQAYRETHRNTLATAAQKRQEWTTLVTHISTIKADQALVTQLTGISERLSAFKTRESEAKRIYTAYQQAETQYTQADQNCHTALQQLADATKAQQDHHRLRLQQQAELSRCLETRSMSEWREHITTLTAEITRVDKISEALETTTKAKQTWTTLVQKHADLVQQKEILAGQNHIQSAQKAALEREKNLLETQLLLLQKIASFDTARHQLQDGEPCPLCGAVDHPFAVGNQPIPDETQQQLSAVREALKSIEAAFSSTQILQAELSKDIAHAKSEQQRCMETLDAAKATMSALKWAYPDDDTHPQARQSVTALQHSMATELAHTHEILRLAEGLEKEIVALGALTDSHTQALNAAERKAQDARHQKETLEQHRDRLKKEWTLAQTNQDAAFARLRQDLLAYLPITDPAFSEKAPAWLDQIETDLTARRDHWLSCEKNKLALEQAMAALDIQIAEQQEAGKSQKALVEAESVRLATWVQEQALLLEERQRVFGQDTPDDQEKALADAVTQADQVLATQQQTLNNTTQELARLTGTIRDLVQTLASKEVAFQAAESVFQTRLAAGGFSSEAHFSAASLSEAERKTLLAEAQALRDAEADWKTRETDCLTRLALARETPLTTSSREDLMTSLQHLRDQQRQLQQDIGALQHKITESDTLADKHRLQLAALEAQKQDCLRWDLLHELIGSSDGKKYRNFAQGLTFDMMIGHANRQLQKMSDRYILVRDTLQPLTLNVIDDYQAGETRSTKNLSGGESFIVSLALALGLSHMASKNVRVDSLFLDEGFGTLDEEALDTALEVLSGLQKEGKMIGIISHIPALKERINTQIQVIPQRGGRSIILGPGCAHQQSL